MPSEYTRMTVDVELAALHHQSLRDVMNRISLQIETFVEPTPSMVNTDGTPKRQCLMLYPSYHRHQHSTQDWKIAHRPMLSSRRPYGWKRTETILQEGGKVSAEEKKAFDAGPERAFNIAIFISDEEAMVLIDLHFRERTKDHARIRLAIEVVAAKFLHTRIGVIRDNSKTARSCQPSAGRMSQLLQACRLCIHMTGICSSCFDSFLN